MALVFVHGIGNQKQGSGTRSLAQAIFRWKEREARDTTHTHLATTDVAAVRTQLTGPEATSSVLDITTNGAKQRWLVTEAWWAECDEPPSAAATLRWLAVYAPLAVVTRCLEAVISAWHSSWNRPLQWWRIPTAMVLVLVATPLSALVLAVSAVATFLRALIPIAWVRSLLDAVVRILTRVLGDSFLFTIDPVARNAMETAVADGLRDVRTNAGRVVVVAHSQGAAIVESTARNHFTETIANTGSDTGNGEGAQAVVETETATSMHLVTLGPGIAQLQWLERVKAKGKLWSGTLAYYLAVLAFAFFVFATTSAVLGINQKIVVAVGLLAGWWALPAAIYKLTLDCYRSGLAVVTPESERPKVPGFASWTNLAATADPVSGTYDLGNMFTGVESRAVCNHNSVARDHTAYLANTTECVSTIVETALGPNSPTAQESNRVRRTRTVTRHRSGQLLVWSRLLIAAGSVLALIGLRDTVQGYGEEGLDHVPSWLLPRLGTYYLPLLGSTPLASAYGVLAVLLGAGAVYLVAVALVRLSGADPDVKSVAAGSGLVILWSVGALVSGLGAVLRHGDATLAVLPAWLSYAVPTWGLSALTGKVLSRNTVVKTGRDLQYWVGVSAVSLSALVVWVMALADDDDLDPGFMPLIVIIGASVAFAVLASTVPRSRPLGERGLGYLEQRLIHGNWPRGVVRDQHIIEHTLTTLGIAGLGVQGAVFWSAADVTSLWPVGFSVLISYAFSMCLFEYSSKLRVFLAVSSWVFTVLVFINSINSV